MKVVPIKTMVLNLIALRHNVLSCTQKNRKLKNDISESSSDYSEQDTLLNVTLPSSSSNSDAKSLQSNTFTKKSVESATVEKHQKEIRDLPSTSTCNKSSSQTLKSSDNQFDDNFKRQVLRQLQIINLRQQQMSENLSVLLIKANSEKEAIILNENSIFKNYDFPLKEVQELEALEEFLIQDNNFQNFVKEIMQIGGASYKHMIKRVLTRMLSNDLSKMYSWI